MTDTPDTPITQTPPYTAENFDTARELLSLEAVEAIRGFRGTPQNDGQGFAIAAIATAAAQAHATLALAGVIGTTARALDERLHGIAQELERLGDLYEPGAGMGELMEELRRVSVEIKGGFDDLRRALPS